jgi:hypothetical protein
MAAASGGVARPDGAALMLVSRLVSEARLRMNGTVPAVPGPCRPRFLALWGYDVGVVATISSTVWCFGRWDDLRERDDAGTPHPPRLRTGGASHRSCHTTRRSSTSMAIEPDMRESVGSGDRYPVGADPVGYLSRDHPKRRPGRLPGARRPTAVRDAEISTERVETGEESAIA